MLRAFFDSIIAELEINPPKAKPSLLFQPKITTLPNNITRVSTNTLAAPSPRFDLQLNLERLQESNENIAQCHWFTSLWLACSCRLLPSPTVSGSSQSLATLRSDSLRIHERPNTQASVWERATFWDNLLERLAVACKLAMNVSVQADSLT